MDTVVAMMITTIVTRMTMMKIIIQQIVHLVIQSTNFVVQLFFHWISPLPIVLKNTITIPILLNLHTLVLYKVWIIMLLFCQFSSSSLWLWVPYDIFCQSLLIGWSFCGSSYEQSIKIWSKNIQICICIHGCSWNFSFVKWCCAASHSSCE